MSKHPLREDKTCLNCNYVVQNRYCSNCGQENTNSRKSFYELFVHFFEDLTHYENSFWRTIRNLLLKPASLTIEYLSGKRMSYLAPIRLYIFISFVTFLSFNIFDSKEDEDETDIKPKNETTQVNSLKQNDTLSKTEKKIITLKEQKKIDEKLATEILSTIQKAEKAEKNDEENSGFMTSPYKSIKELDSVKKVDPQKISALEYWFSKKSIAIHDKYTGNQIKERFVEEVKHNFPKSLFVYMPMFAFVLWIFHNKKRWYYFDHGIFTLHYFSFLLLISLVLLFLDLIFGLFDNWFVNTLQFISSFTGVLWMIYYFFSAHHRFYKESRTISFIKSISMFVINSILIVLVMILLVIYSFISIN